MERARRTGRDVSRRARLLEPSEAESPRLILIRELMNLMIPSTSIISTVPEVSMRSRVRLYSLALRAFFSLMITSLALTLCVCAGHSAPPRDRVDVASGYTWVPIGDWQHAVLSYNRQWSKRWSAGVTTQYLRRGYNELRLSDLSFGLPITYRAHPRFTLATQLDVTPIAQISPRYAGEVTPRYQLEGGSLAISMRYRYAQYSIADTHLVQPGLEYRSARLLAELYTYIVFPTFGPNTLTPQLRLTYTLSYKWRIGWWTTYGFETLNERFFNPSRQAPKWDHTLRVSHLFTDYQGVNLGVSYTRFITDDPALAQEVFNQDRVGLSTHYFVKF